MSRGRRQAEIWFQENPKKTLVLLVLGFFLAILIGTEQLLKFYHHRDGVIPAAENEMRYIRLREYRPLTQMRLRPAKDIVKYTDEGLPISVELDIDANGFIKPSQKYVHPDLSIVFLGGSTTECRFVDEDRRFPCMAGNILEKETGKKINAYNGGLSVNNSLHAIDLLINKVIPIHPRVVVFMENINDLSTLLYEKTYWSQNGIRAPLETLDKVKLMGKLLKEILIPHLNFTYRNMKGTVFPREEDKFAQARGKKLMVDPAKLARQFAANLQIIVDVCRDWGITPVLMTQASRITPHPDPVVAASVGRYESDTGIAYQDFKALYDLFNDTIRQVGQKNGVLVIDLAREVPANKQYIYDMVHLNEAGSLYSAKLIAAELKPLIVSREQ